MPKKYLSMEDILVELQIDPSFLRELLEAELVAPKKTLDSVSVFSHREVERIRVIRNLVHNLGVNLEGVEVILHMRETMMQMQAQFDQILEQLIEELRREVLSPERLAAILARHQLRLSPDVWAEMRERKPLRGDRGEKQE
jgi:MerR family transcriptional regulator/heat shock protein HspR